MKKYENTYIYSDFDGTLSTWKFEIPQNNIDAIRYFTENGGHFGIATGRGKDGVSDLPIAKYINMPVILANGAVIAELDKEEPLFADFLPKRARDVALEMRDKFPNIAILVWGIKTRFDISDRNFCRREDAFKNTVRSSIEEVKEPWTRLLFYVEPEHKAEMTEYIKKLSKGELTVTTSGKECIGVMSKTVSKGKTIEKIIEKYSIARNNLYICGDFDNDIPMLSVEGARSFCPSTAQDCVKEIADHILCSVDEGIVPQLLKFIDEDIEEK